MLDKSEDMRRFLLTDIFPQEDVWRNNALDALTCVPPLSSTPPISRWRHYDNSEVCLLNNDMLIFMQEPRRQMSG
jgi:hypothetical protein